MSCLRFRNDHLNAGWLALLVASGCADADPVSDGREFDDGDLSRTREELTIEIDESTGSTVTPQELARIDAYLDQRVEPSTIIATLPYGDDLFDCVPELEQPSVRKLRDQGINIDRLERPPPLPAEAQQAFVMDSDESSALAYTLGPTCPEGSVSIRRTKREEILVAGSLDAYLGRAPREAPAETGYQYAELSHLNTNSGGRGHISLWDDYIDKNSDHAIAQIWVARGDGTTRETVEAGWVKYKGQAARLFIYATPNNYTTSCWNNDCGFVQFSGTGVTLGGAFSNYSTQGGTQYTAHFQIVKLGATGWWFYLNGTAVGHWPVSFFSSDGSGLKDKASRFRIGGEVYDAGGGSHTGTDMGSGAWPSQGWQQAAFVRQVQYYTYDPIQLLDLPTDIVPDATDTDCYTGAGFNSSDANWKRGMYFGGPGFNSSCP